MLKFWLHSEFKDKIKNINSFMRASFERLGYKEHKAIHQEKKKRMWRIGHKMPKIKT